MVAASAPHPGQWMHRHFGGGCRERNWRHRRQCSRHTQLQPGRRRGYISKSKLRWLEKRHGSERRTIGSTGSGRHFEKQHGTTPGGVSGRLRQTETRRRDANFRWGLSVLTNPLAKRLKTIELYIEPTLDSQIESRE